MRLTLDQYVARVGLNSTARTYLAEQFGTEERIAEEWTRLISRLLSSPETAWISGCFVDAPHIADDTSTPLPLGEGYLRRRLGVLEFVPLEIPDAIPEGEGFLERHNGDVQLTPLLIEEVTPDEGGAISTTFAPTTWGNNGPS